MTKIYDDKGARDNVLEGARILYEVVKTTMGPKGRNILIRDKFGKFTVTHDGVTVARSIQLKDDKTTTGVELIKEASRKMDETGDGTTSVTVLTYHLMQQASALIEKGENPMMIKRELEAQVEPLIAQIKERAVKIGKTAEDILPVATVAVGSKELGHLVSDLMADLGYEGAITVETTQLLETTTKVVEGYVLDRGYMSPYFATEAREAKLQNPAIIVTKGTIFDLQDYENVFNALIENKIGSVLVVAENIEADALSTLILNKVKGNLNVVAVKAPGMGDAKLDNLKDLCAVTGAELIDPEVGDWQSNLGFNTLGAAEQVVVSNDETVVIGGQGDGLLDARVEKLKKRMKKAKLDEKEFIELRIAKLNGKVGIIKVGGATDTQAEEKKYRIDDAIASVKAALTDGIVAGGGVTLRDIGRTIDNKENSASKMILQNALLAPFRVLLENSGVEDKKILDDGFGYNVLTGEVVNTFEAGIVDPAKVTIEVVRNAITTACLAITVGGSIVEEQLTNDEMMKLMNAGN